MTMEQQSNGKRTPRYDGMQVTNVAYLEQLYQQYQREPQTLSTQWQAFFQGFDYGYEGTPLERPLSQPTVLPASPAVARDGYALVKAYREMGHCLAHLNPLRHPHADQSILALEEFAFRAADLEQVVGTGGFLGTTDGTLGDLLAKLQQTYCQSLGVEYIDIVDQPQRLWLQQQVETQRSCITSHQAQALLERLIAAEAFEQFLHTRYIGQKRFSLEGAETLIPLLDGLIHEGAQQDAQEIIMGMAHRGRLNVLAHVLRKPYETILSEFAGTIAEGGDGGRGDVKYHLGYSYDYLTPQGRQVHLSLAANPSHLELVNPVIEGMVYAKQQAVPHTSQRQVIPVLIHGEAAFTGQGIVAETLTLTALEGYRTGGTIHIILNNQIGFTASPAQTRASLYPTAVAKMVHAPVLHVNADDPEAVLRAAQLAMAFRQRFGHDVLIDLWCYRRHGHNETDDPTFTQPLMYQEIHAHPSVTHLYAQHLQERGMVTEEAVQSMRQEVHQQLEAAHTQARQLRPRQQMHSLGGRWQGLTRAGADWEASTAVSANILQHILARTTQVPGDFALHPKLQRFLEARRAMGQGTRPVDWGCAEMLAFGSLLLEGTAVRLVGQDSERGTFSHRHAVWIDEKTEARYVPLTHLAADQASCTILNTMLSELAVVGFEYGVSSADPWQLVLWEGQFGDFANGAQPIIDQFLASAEAKWQRMSGLVLLLPHGYEGQGPEHSSARLERFLQLCAEQNLQICCPTTPAQYFHVLRRQMHRNFRKPLIVMTPKSFLRHEAATSPLAAFTAGGFAEVLDDPARPQESAVQRIVLCSGKVYFDLLAARQRQGLAHVALVRVEQLYPFPEAMLDAVLKRYADAAEVAWVQEEPQNMGAWNFLAPRLRALLADPTALSYYGRPEAASPATGLYAQHQQEQAALVQQALAAVPGGVHVAVDPAVAVTL